MRMVYLIGQTGSHAVFVEKTEYGFEPTVYTGVTRENRKHSIPLNLVPEAIEQAEYYFSNSVRTKFVSWIIRPIEFWPGG